MRTLVWIRGKDLRVSDHPPLLDAASRGEVIPLFVLDPFFFAPARAQEIPHRIQFLLESLRELSGSIAALGSRLILVEGKSVDVVPRLAAEWNVDRVVAHRWVEPFARERDRRVADALRVPFVLYEGEMLLPPETLRTSAGEPYSVFTPFARAFHATASIAKPLPAPRALPPLPPGVDAPRIPIPTLESVGIVRNDALLAGGEGAARARLDAFLSGPAAHYHTARDRMDRAGTSRLSQDLKFGTLSARTVWTAIDSELGESHAARVFKNELVWREFAHSTLWDRPDLLMRPFRPGFEGFPWVRNEAHWRAWTEGRTGYPVVDAAARQLLGEGFVHNRARMIAAGFLTKHLRVDYRRGEAHYMKYLTDGDWAQNNFGWQWSAGCGCDAQAYFRVFNPIIQGGKFDPEGAYVRRWVTELARVPAKWIHRPWEAPAPLLRHAGVVLGENYPRPIVDHSAAREAFLAAANRHLRT
ncbi:MAG TPA: deoxyribodipyrimidine photo-lyase [Candidatus Krumholzibacteria bacterium]|nr:deoxyribodipyrimidine photo-lyase [Candidatus Krumholzibacteria bacterium]